MAPVQHPDEDAWQKRNEPDPPRRYGGRSFPFVSSGWHEGFSPTLCRLRMPGSTALSGGSKLVKSRPPWFRPSNLDDNSPRALRVLGEFVSPSDVRQGKLLAYH